MDQIISIFFNTWFIWLPIILGVVFWDKWMSWRNAKYAAGIKWTLLEISIPKDVHKSPEAMEIIFNTLNEGSGVGTMWKKYVDGNRPHFFSLEIISIEGSIYFFIRTPDKFKDLIKNQIYSQYPTAEVHEVDDYTRYVGDFASDPGAWQLFGVEFALTGNDAYPIKTYVDYGLDRAVGTLEEEQKIDPITSTMEYLGSVRKNEQVWIQMIIRSDKWHPWRKDAIAEVNKLMGRDKEDEVSTLKMTYGEQEKVKAIERSLTKHAFEVGFRGLYLARDGAFRGSNIAGLIGSVRQYNSPHLNGFRPGPKTDYDYLYQDPTGSRLRKSCADFFTNYVNRAYFHDAETDYFEKNKKSFILTAEELATMFRFPGRVSETTNLERVEATKAEAPSNLPI